MGEGGGTGPGDHPGVTIVPLTSDLTATQAALEAAYASKADFAFVWTLPGQTFAVFVTKY